MANASTSVPEIIRNLNLVTEQFDPVDQNPTRMQKSNTAENDLSLRHQLLTNAEQAICDMATD